MSLNEILNHFKKKRRKIPGNSQSPELRDEARVYDAFITLCQELKNTNQKISELEKDVSNLLRYKTSTDNEITSCNLEIRKLRKKLEG